MAFFLKLKLNYPVSLKNAWLPQFLFFWIPRVLTKIYFFQIVLNCAKISLYWWASPIGNSSILRCRYLRVQEWRSGESTRLPPMWPGFDSSTQRPMWVEFVGSLLCTERFSPGTPVSPLLKNQHFTWFSFIVNFSLQCPQLMLQR